MLGRNQISDKDLAKTVAQKLSRAGANSQSRIAAAIQQGMVTLTENLKYAGQRGPIVKSVACLAGVRRTVDQMQLIEPKRT
jgi:osmotically-inducible protein OsmY